MKTTYETTYLEFKIGVAWLVNTIRRIMPAIGAKVTKAWNDDEDIIFHVKYKGHKMKIKIRIVSHKKIYLGVWIKSIVIDGWLPIKGKPLGLGMNLFKSVIKRSLPMAEIRNQGSTIFLENIRTKDIEMSRTTLRGKLFIHSNIN